MVLTVGVEEEFVLLEPDGAVAPVAADVVRHAGGGQVMQEYLAYQLETATRVCTGLDELHAELARLRLRAAEAAERAGARLVATGAAPFAAGRLDALTDDPRYDRLARRFPAATAAGGTCACQVHVGVPDRDLAVAVLARIRPWLSTLLAMTVNSPYSGGIDSGWASSRYRAQLRWPTFRPPQVWTSAERYDREVHSLIASGAAMDRAGVYFLARLSPRYPTVEVRVADACLTAYDAVVFAGVVRGLVATLIDDVRRGGPSVPVPTDAVSANLLAAAQHGMRRHGDAAPPEQMPGSVARLLAKITPQLDAAGDADHVRAGLERLHQLGTGADRQRRLWTRAGSAGAFVRSLAEVTAPVAASSS